MSSTLPPNILNLKHCEISTGSCWQSRPGLAISCLPDNWIALEEDDLSDEGGDEGEVTDLDEAGGNFSDNEVFELY